MEGGDCEHASFIAQTDTFEDDNGSEHDDDDVTSVQELTDSEQPPWDADSGALECRQCRAPFKLMRRKHHCRGCGRVFCSDCSSKRHEMPESYKLRGLQRACNDCYFALLQCAMEQSGGGLGSGRSDDVGGAGPEPCAPSFATLYGDLLGRARQAQAASEDAWVTRHTHSQGGVVAAVRKRGPRSGLTCVRLTTSVAASVSNLWGTYHSPHAWADWVPDLLDHRVIAEVHEPPDASIMFSEIRAANGDRRDWCLLRAKAASPLSSSLPAGTRTIVLSSTEHPLCPKFGVSRIDLDVAIVQMRPLADETTDLTLIAHLESKGLSGPFALGKCLVKACEAIAALKHAAELGNTR